MKSNHLSVLAVVFLIAGAFAAQAQETISSPAVKARPELARALKSAAREFKIPLEVLQAIAFVETRWTHQNTSSETPGAGAESKGEGEHASRPPVYGVMGLRNDSWFGDSLVRAAKLVRLPESRLRSDPVANIRGAAAYLRSLQPEALRTAKNPADWEQAIRRYPGIPDAEGQDLYIQDVYRVIAQGEARFGIAIASTDDERVRSRFRTLGPMLAPDNDRATRPSAEDNLPPELHWDPSPNFKVGGITQHYVVIHDTEGNFASAVSWLKNPIAQASAHFIIRSSDGYVKQLVDENDRAWHARCWNPYALGIEHEGYADSPEYFTKALYEASIALTRYLTRKYSIPADDMHVFGHDFWSTDRYKQNPPAELANCNNHTDPGKGWDWESYYRAIR